MTYDSVNYGCGGGALAFTGMAETTSETMGVRISRQMDVKNLSQSTLAKVLGVSRMTVSQWCRDVSEPKPGHLLNLAEVLFDGDVLYMVHGSTREPAEGFPTLTAAARRRKT